MRCAIGRGDPYVHVVKVVVTDVPNPGIPGGQWVRRAQWCIKTLLISGTKIKTLMNAPITVAE
jgi:hypothetical protein